MEFHGDGADALFTDRPGRWGSHSGEGLDRPGGGIEGGARGAAACARDRTLVACGRSIGDGASSSSLMEA